MGTALIVGLAGAVLVPLGKYAIDKIAAKREKKRLEKEALNEIPNDGESPQGEIR
jgi:hypothetical protein